ncbi:hypothetical protein [Phycobacter sp. K97]|jgi:hypothetical protein|uniref:hypothetical protein n=1 Tax=Phycobacter sedimenti TaxID=3133977 RepID=UPI00311FFCCA
MRSLLLGGAAFVAVGLSPLLALAAHQGVREGQPVLVIAAPWSAGAAEVIVRSGLEEISPERAPFGALTVLGDVADAGRLKQNGALFVIDGKMIAQICAE